MKSNFNINSASTNVSLDSNVLGVNYNGSAVEKIYHPYKALFSDDVKRFSLKEKIGNKYLYLFFKSIEFLNKNANMHKQKSMKIC